MDGSPSLVPLGLVARRRLPAPGLRRETCSSRLPQLVLRPGRITTRASPGHSLRSPQPLAQQGIRHGGDSLPGLRHRLERDHLQRHRRRAAQAVPLHRSRQDRGGWPAESAHRQPGRPVVPRHAGLERGQLGLHDDCRRRRTQLDDLRPRRRAGALPGRRDFVGPVSTAGASPILGHGFTVEDDRPGAGPVVLLGYDLWTRRYHGDARRRSNRS